MVPPEPETPSWSSDVVSNALVRSLQEQLTGARSENLHLTQRLLVVEEELAKSQRPQTPVDTQPWRHTAIAVLVQALAQAELELADALVASEESRASVAAGLRAAEAREARLVAELKELAEELEPSRARSSEEVDAAGRAAVQHQGILALRLVQEAARSREAALRVDVEQYEQQALHMHMHVCKCICICI